VQRGMQIVCHSKERLARLVGSEGVGVVVSKTDCGQKYEASPEMVESAKSVDVEAIGRVQGGGAKVLGGGRM
jgi:hypothetical protein